MTRARFVIGNWKMNPATLTDAIDLARRVARGPTPKGVQVGVAPPAIFLPEIADALRETPIAVYAQNISAEERGAFTGQISAAMAKAFAVATLVGHSEVRRDLGDDDERVARKVARALSEGLPAVLCIGESGGEFDAGETGDVLVRQLSGTLRGLRTAGETNRLPERLVIAYEPVWAIGTGRPATPEHATSAALAIRQLMSDALGPDGDAISILYGGSVTAATAPQFAKADGIDGALVGGASLDAMEFAGIVRAFA